MNLVKLLLFGLDQVSKRSIQTVRYRQPTAATTTPAHRKSRRLSHSTSGTAITTTIARTGEPRWPGVGTVQEVVERSGNI